MYNLEKKRKHSLVSLKYIFWIWLFDLSALQQDILKMALLQVSLSGSVLRLKLFRFECEKVFWWWRNFPFWVGESVLMVARKQYCCLRVLISWRRVCQHGWNCIFWWKWNPREGKLYFTGTKMDVLRMKERLKRNVDFIAFKSFPLSNHFCVVGSALGHHFDP